MSAMTAKLNALTQRIDSLKANQGNDSKNSKDYSNLNCHHCGKKGHIRPHCPDRKNNSNGKTPSPLTNTKDWMIRPPAEGASEVKVVDGIEYRFCCHCKLGKKKQSMWCAGSKAHVTADCRSKKKPEAANALATIEEAPPEDNQDDEEITGPLTFSPFH